MPTRTCDATAHATDATTDNEHVHDANDGSDKHAKNNKRCCSDHSKIEFDSSKSKLILFSVMFKNV